jgi:hypothetical protein
LLLIIDKLFRFAKANNNNNNNSPQIAGSG